jgi:hypothetical protein
MTLATFFAIREAEAAKTPWLAVRKLTWPRPATAPASVLKTEGLQLELPLLEMETVNPHHKEVSHVNT